MEIVAADIGGTHARFSLAEIADGPRVSLGEPVKLPTADHASLRMAWEAFADRLGRPLPPAAAIALAAALAGDTIKLTNSDWIVRPDGLGAELGLDRHVLLNDFAAAAHAADGLDAAHFATICGPADPLPETGAITVVGPGTGLGVALILRAVDHSHILATEGGHGDFAPLDAIEDRILARLRKQHRRVSVERIVSGPGLRAIYKTLADIENRAPTLNDDRTLWAAALDGADSLAAAALDRFCLCLGAVAGDIALAHGPGPVVIAGGLGARLADILPQSGFAERFAAKGRYQSLMESLPVKLITHPEPGLYGAALAFAKEHGQ
ncbi:glucokinase [Parasphingopyxis algicola]|uniref:glucokinase n=1 Tax=Parasphingopyxis algicola TaxID=2026624 RepID=UPI0015A1BC05|nr:glucokinase [Parasphingopyxis algicola]QLC25374.1 glucokinase [Parasphingopyxis algicola]